jgi:VIT1/CCC1 family predicted Fe2+/Mn2+ transporter
MPRILNPVERHSEIIFGLIMALSFTCTLSVAESGEAEVRTLLWAALGCNLAWGIVDAVMYLLMTLLERGRELTLHRAIQDAATPETASRILAQALPETAANALPAADLERLRRAIVAQPLPSKPRLTGRDVLGALGVLLLVFASTFPVALPFVVADPARALRISNGVAIGMLFAAGWSLGRYAGFHPLRTGLVMVAVGTTCVAVTIALGG